MGKRFAFVDTNIFIHYKPIDHVDWPQLVGTDEAALVVTPIVIRELNKHKDFPRSPKTKERAAAALRKLHLWSEQTPPIMIRDSVELQFRIKDSAIDFARENLAREIPDDHLVACIIEFRNEHESHDVILVTADLGLKLKARAHSIAVIDLPEELRLPEQPDPSQKRIKDLEQEVRQLRERIPILKLTSRTRQDRIQLTLGIERELSGAQVSRSMEEIRKKYPKMERSTVENPLPVVDLGFGIPAQEITQYNEAMEKFYKQYESYLSMHHGFHNLQQRIARLELSLVNEGTCPAEDIDVRMHFPDGFRLVDEEHLPKQPPRPEPPARPKTLKERIEESFKMPNILTNFTGYAPDLKLSAPSNMSSLSIRRTKSYDVDLSVKKLKHGFAEHLDPMFLIFDSLNSASSFSIDYRIHAGNIPEPSEGKVHVIIERTNAGT